MARTKKPATTATASTLHRLQVIATEPQAAIITDAATRAGFERDRSTWMLAQCMRAAGASSTTGGAIILEGPVADRVRAEAKRQGVTPEQIIEQWSATAT